AVEKPKEIQPQVKSQEQGSDSGVAVQPNIVQSWLAQYSVTVESGKEGLISKMEPKAGYKLAQLIAGLKSDKFPPGLEPIVKPTGSEAPQTVTDVQLGSKIVLPNALLTNTGNPVANSSSQIPVTAIAVAKVTSGQESGQESASTGDGKTITAGQKPAVMGISNVSGGQKMASLTNNESASEVLTGGSSATTDGEESAVAGQSTISGTQKTSVPDGSLEVVQAKSTDILQDVLVGPKKSATITEEPVGGEAETGQQYRVLTSQNTAKLSSDETLSEFSPGNGKDQAENPTGQSILHKLGHARVQVSAKQTSDRGGSSSSNGSNSDSQQVSSNTDAPMHAIDQPSGSPQAAKSADNALSGNLSTDIGEQIQESISSSVRRGGQQITIHLNPPELGKVSIRFQEQGGQIAGLLEVSKIETRYEIEQALPQIIRSLGDCGIQIKRLEVMLADQPEQQAYKDQTLQNGWSEQRGSAEANNPHAGGSDTGEWSTNSNTLTGFSEPRGLVTDHSINMLV
ncbi:MAG: flagellar hook-length control protein FliK, partial [Planctomycetota bacterium]